MKYQIILESNEQIPDDEFKNFVEGFLNLDGRSIIFPCKLIDARNLEGIRKELWDLREKALNATVDCNLTTSTFDEIKELFKL